MESNKSAIEIYQSPEGNVEVKVKPENDTLWLSANQMAILFGRDRTVIGRHIRNCFKEGELDSNITCAKSAHMEISYIIDNRNICDTQFCYSHERFCRH